MTASKTKQISGLITQTSFKELPEDVVRKAKFLVLDSIGCGLGGSVTTLGKTVKHALAKDSIGNAPIFGSEETTSIPNEDIELVASQAGVSHEDAKKALEECGGEPAEAIIKLMSE